MDILAILNRVEVLLRESGHSKSELYAACSVSASAISQWKSGRTSPSTKSLQSIADYLNVSYEYLISGVGQKEKTPTKSGEQGDALDSTESSRRLKLLARHLNRIPEETRNRLINNFEDTIDTYLDAMGIPRESEDS